MENKYLKYAHTIAAIALALFFVNAGVKKFIPRTPKASDNTQLLNAVSTDKYVQPAAFMLTIKAMKQTGFLKMVGIFQILAGLLILLPLTRLLGLIVLVPLILNIFLLHVFMDNRMHENVETGLLLAANIILLAYYYKRIPLLFGNSTHIQTQLS